MTTYERMIRRSESVKRFAGGIFKRYTTAFIIKIKERCLKTCMRTLSKPFHVFRREKAFVLVREDSLWKQNKENLKCHMHMSSSLL